MVRPRTQKRKQLPRKQKARPDAPAHALPPPDASAVPDDPRARLGRKETARALTASGYPVAAASLERYAVTGEGPPYEKFGQFVIYTWGTTLAWAKARATAPMRSAAEHRQQHRPVR
jgi:hypothetical protein